MSLGDGKYRAVAALETRAAEEILYGTRGDVEWLVPGVEGPSYYSDSMLDFIDHATKRLGAEGCQQAADELRLSETEMAIYRRANELRREAAADQASTGLRRFWLNLIGRI